MATTAPRPHAEPWPSALRLATGLVQPGGPAMVRRALEGVGLEAADRVVELAPGIGATTAVRAGAGAAGVDRRRARPDRGRAPRAGARRARAARWCGRRSTRPGLADDTATVADRRGPPEHPRRRRGGRRCWRRRGASCVRAGGSRSTSSRRPTARPIPRRRTISPRPGSDPGRSRRGAPSRRTPGSSSWGRWPAASPRPRRVSSCAAAGPRTALRVTREIARDGALRSAVSSTRQTLERRAVSLRSALVVAEVPLILGMRRPRR